MPSSLFIWLIQRYGMAGANYILVIDVGSSKTGCSLFSSDLRLVISRETPTPVRAEPVISPLARNIPTDELWLLIAKLVKDALLMSKISPDQVTAVSVTGQREAMVFLDDSGKVLYAGPNTDLRALMEGAAIDESHLDYVYKTSGHRPSFMFAPAKLQWMKSHGSDKFARVGKVISLPDWVVFKLTGCEMSEVTLAQECGYADLNGKPAKELFNKVGLSDSYLPRLANSGVLVGNVLSALAKTMGLSVKAKVYLAGPDTQCALLGMGVINAGDVGIVAGFSSPLQMVTNHRVLDPKMRIWTGRHLIKDRWVLESNVAEVGSSYRWLISLLFGGDSARDYKQAESLASRAPVGSNETISMLGPALMDMRNLGLRAGGILFPVPMTMTEVEKGQIVRSSLEAIAYTTRQNLAQLESIAGKRAKQIFLGGGFTRNKLYRQILADVLNREILVCKIPNVSSVGAAICSGGASDNEGLTLLTTVYPSGQNASSYNHYYKKWVATSKKMSKLTEVLS
ncbi:MAG: hypothetical protein EXR59_02120 [Dehalococcoidia bacterium]|nr:hypothetical protein [Dehalococcoidia bacterium]